MKSKKSIIKILLDIILTVLFVSFFSYKLIGGKFHEIVGLGILFLFLVHILLNYKWVVNVGKKLFSKKLKFKTRFGYCVDILLLISMLTIAITGVLISKTVLISVTSNNAAMVKTLHKSASYLTLGLVGVHVGLHINFIKNMASKVYKPSKKIGKTLSIITLIICLAIGGIGIVNTNYFESANVFKIMSIDEGNGGRPEGTNGGQQEGEASGGKQEGGANGGKQEGGAGFAQASNGISKILYVFYCMIAFASLTVLIEKIAVKIKAKKV